MKRPLCTAIGLTAGLLFLSALPAAADSHGAALTEQDAADFIAGR